MTFTVEVTCTDGEDVLHFKAAATVDGKTVADVRKLTLVRRATKEYR